jgi:hypothetical protein
MEARKTMGAVVVTFLRGSWSDIAESSSPSDCLI